MTAGRAASGPRGSADGRADRSYRLYARGAALAFVLVAAYTVPAKLLQGRLADDWLHSVLHLGSGLLGAWAGWATRGVAPARAFTWGVGLLYGGLGLVGWSTNGLLLGTPFAIPLGAAENAFHLVLGVPALAVIGWSTRQTR